MNFSPDSRGWGGGRLACIFPACEEFGLSTSHSLLLLPQSKSAVADFDQS